MLTGDLQRGTAQHNDQILQGGGHSSLASLETRVKLATENVGGVLAKSPLEFALNSLTQKL